jgi:hypothetical protein
VTLDGELDLLRAALLNGSGSWPSGGAGTRVESPAAHLPTRALSPSLSSISASVVTPVTGEEKPMTSAT